VMSKKMLVRLLADPGLPTRRLARLLLRCAGLRPPSEPFISGDTFRNVASHLFDETKKVRVSELQPGDIVFCSGDFLQEFSEVILEQVTVPLLVILGNSDRNHSRSNWPIDDSGLPHQFFVQNLMDEIPGCEPIPIGLENRHWQNVGRPRDFSNSRRKSRTNRIMWSFTVRTNKPLRKVAERELRENPLAVNIGEVSPSAHRRALSSYSFVACPPGNGWDTHRTWEALYLGCIPIVLDSFFARTFLELGVPIWIVETYSELLGLTEQDLETNYRELSGRLDSPLLRFDFWSQSLQERSQSIRESFKELPD